MQQSLWHQCLGRLEGELTAQQFNTWIRPLKAELDDDGMRILAPNRFVLDWVSNRFLDRIKEICSDLEPGAENSITLGIFNGKVSTISSPPKKETVGSDSGTEVTKLQRPAGKTRRKEDAPNIFKSSSLNPQFTFDSFVEGKSNQLARAASQQVADNPGREVDREDAALRNLSFAVLQGTAKDGAILDSDHVFDVLDPQARSEICGVRFVEADKREKHVYSPLSSID